MKNRDKAIILGIVVLSLVLLYWSISTSMKSGKAEVKKVVSDIPEHAEESFKKAQEAETEDPCTTPEGYTDEAWRQHMNHHPDQYKDCL